MGENTVAFARPLAGRRMSHRQRERDDEGLHLGGKLSLNLKSLNYSDKALQLIHIDWQRSVLKNNLPSALMNLTLLLLLLFHPRIIHLLD